MAQVKQNLVTSGLSGGIEKKIVLKHYGDITVVTAFPDMSNVKLTESQKKENSRFKDAMAYARSQMADPVAKAEYQAKAKGLQRAINMAIADFYHPPKIKSIDLALFHGRRNDPVTIKVVDNFKVVKVTVTMLDQRGITVESGDAREIHLWHWEYRLKGNYSSGEQLIINASVWDKPGNKTEAEENTSF